ncbi:hypothetical protein RAB80_014004 [Fusarium oxysporum f. sp. vasinfectum]|uniref:Extracellular membrane protein CFEM domain-containing protein n=1 Tax=Fusarium oxysporum f. sp. vasinfectum 25433 TaxID=1089449 RepID=X0LZS2_FUSOX|nr:hypothetical protein FOTG_17632 [Fusarium oxysporum f. sp. vasinfectum 25433]KAK2669867.1 hypothetical protein RAB80_014004 [Fusarium oxysporum f. sp. vasinfectum]KAK2923114.1 hypothetical protein FoTM2_016636 [Fusarium oxysporum f. sp. vasinfectum]
MNFLKALLLAVPAVYACGDNAYRCKNPDKTVSEMYRVTKNICDELKEDTCWCYHWAEDYCDPFGDNIKKFKQKCEDYGENWYWSEC